jgi:hypothetical protein
MDINLRVSTGNSTQSPVQEPMLKSDSQITSQVNTSNSNSSNTSLASPVSSNTSSQSILPTSSSGQVSTPLAANNVNININTGTEAKQEDWVSTLVSSFKSLFETFTSNITKLLESWFGSKPVNSGTGTSSGNAGAVNGNTGNTSGTASNTSSQAQGATSTNTAPRQVESFSQRTAKNLGDVAKGSVNEQQMQEAVVMYQLYQKDEELETVFKSKLSEAKSQGKTGESAVKSALVETEKSGKIARWESDWVFSLSYRAAQFDSEVGNLVTASSMKSPLAIQTAERNLLSIATGVEIPVSRTVV